MLRLFYLHVVLALFLGTCLSSCLSYRPVTFGPTHEVSIHELNRDKLSLKFVQEIENPNGYAIRIKNPQLTIKAGRTTLSAITCTPKIKLKAHSTARYNLEISAASESVLLLAGQVMTGQVKQLNVEGSVRVGVFLCSRKMPVHYTLKL